MVNPTFILPKGDDLLVFSLISADCPSDEWIITAKYLSEYDKETILRLTESRGIISLLEKLESNLHSYIFDLKNHGEFRRGVAVALDELKAILYEEGANLNVEKR